MENNSSRIIHGSKAADNNIIKVKCPKCLKTLSENTLKYYHTACEGKPTIKQRRQFITYKNKEKQNKQVDLIEISDIDDSIKSGIVCFFSTRCC